MNEIIKVCMDQHGVEHGIHLQYLIIDVYLMASLLGTPAPPNTE